MEKWEEVWDEITPGTEPAIRQHLQEIVNLLEKAVESPSWNMKAQVSFFIYLINGFIFISNLGWTLYFNCCDSDGPKIGRRESYEIY